MFINKQKINFILHVALAYSKDIVNLLFWVLWACLAAHTQSDAIIFREKINFIAHAFMEILQKCANLFWIFWACLVTLTQIGSINLLKTAIIICMQKTNFIIHFFFKILQFKESCNYVRDPKLYQIWRWNINNNVSFHFRLFPRNKSFKNLKNPILWSFWAIFVQILATHQKPVYTINFFVRYSQF